MTLGLVNHRPIAHAGLGSVTRTRRIGFGIMIMPRVHQAVFHVPVHAKGHVLGESAVESHRLDSPENAIARPEPAKAMAGVSR